MIPYSIGKEKKGENFSYLLLPLVVVNIMLAFDLASSGDSLWLNCISNFSANFWPAP